MLTRELLEAFFDELEKIGEIGMPAPASIHAINQPLAAGTPSPASVVKGNAQLVPWGQSSVNRRLVTQRAGRLRNMALAATQEVTPIRKAITGVLRAAA